MQEKQHKNNSKKGYLELRINLLKENCEEFKNLCPKNLFSNIKQRKDLQKRKQQQTEFQKTTFQKRLLAQFLVTQLYETEFQKQEFQKLNVYDKFFVFYFLQRKQKCKNFQVNTQKVDQLDQQINNFVQLASQGNIKKTTQQQLQFLVKLGMKKLRQKLIVQKVIDHNFSHEKFYGFYFQKVSEKNQIPIRNFFDPRNKNSHSKEKNTYKKEYVLLLLKSFQFKTDFFSFLQKDIYNFYRDIAQQRIERLIDLAENKVFLELKIKEKQENLINEIQIVDKILQQCLIKNQQSKLPWSYHEIYQSISTLCQIVRQEQINQEQGQYFEELKLSSLFNKQQLNLCFYQFKDSFCFLIFFFKKFKSEPLFCSIQNQFFINNTDQ